MERKKRLYQIVDTRTRRPIEGLYFSDKKKAKEKRRSLNDFNPVHDEQEQLRYIVSPGPDHHRYAES